MRSVSSSSAARCNPPTCWCAGRHLLWHQVLRVLQLEREKTLRAAALAQEAQLKMLRYQLNPHFLFNTLNAISTLILDNHNRTANQTVMRLSEFLRYTLDQDPMKKVTLRQEIEAMNCISPPRSSGSATVSSSNMRSKTPRSKRWCPACCCSRSSKTP